jgi:hypothetical protein
VEHHHDRGDRSDQRTEDRRGDEETIRARRVHLDLASRTEVPARNIAREHNVLAGTDGVVNAFWPRRVASSETATKAKVETTATRACADARTASEPNESAALHSAFAKRAVGRRSGKLAMFSYTRDA